MSDQPTTAKSAASPSAASTTASAAASTALGHGAKSTSKAAARAAAAKIAKKIFLSEINEKGSELELNPEVIDWLDGAVARVDEKDDSEDHSGPHAADQSVAPAQNSLSMGAPSRAPGRSIEGLLSIRKVDEVVVISGRIKTTLQLACSRCANTFAYKANPQFSTLFCKDPVMAGVAYTDKTGKPVGQNQGYARHAHAEDMGDPSFDQSESSDSSLDITYLTDDFIDLSDVVTEQLRLEVPFQPLCKEDCKGICPTCGTDFNVGRCACAKITKTSPFSVLQNIKL